MLKFAVALALVVSFAAIRTASAEPRIVPRKHPTMGDTLVCGAALPIDNAYAERGGRIYLRCPVDPRTTRAGQSCTCRIEGSLARLDIAVAGYTVWVRNFQR
jgi:hypothetical protein